MFSLAARKTSKFLNKKNSNPPEESATDSGNSSEQAINLKYRSMKAFRTIITMLAIIPSQRVRTVVDRKSEHGPEDKELKLLNALATLLVRCHEVAAVAVTNRDDKSGNIQVIACHHISSHGPPQLTIPQPASKFSTFKNFLVAFNPRKDDSNAQMFDRPTIINPIDDIPSELRETTDMMMISTYCYNMW